MGLVLEEEQVVMLFLLKIRQVFQGGLVSIDLIFLEHKLVYVEMQFHERPEFIEVL